MAKDEAPRRVPSTAGYGENAAALAVKYESIPFAEVHRHIAHLISPAPPVRRIVDIGAGTGRDAAALAALGHDVTAVEPTPELRAFGQHRHADAAIVWIDDALPDLASMRTRGEASFDLVLLTAVWMHLDAEERSAAMPNVAALVAPEGLLAMTLRHGPVPSGRRMFDVSPEETTDLAGRSELTLVHSSRRGDMFGRAEIGWDVLVFRRVIADLKTLR